MHGILIYYIIYKVEIQGGKSTVRFSDKNTAAYIPFISDAENMGRILIFP